MSSQDAQTDTAHEPVLLEEVLGWLRPQLGGLFIDCTLGLGGHTKAILEASPETRVIGIDRDLEALAHARARLKGFETRFQALHANFKDLADALDKLVEPGARGVLADLGVSSLQLDHGERGFSFASDAPLDMRMDQTSDRTAADLVNNLAEHELADLIFEYGEERGARRVARLIVKEREREPITTTNRLADVVIRALNIPGRWRIHPATRTFQALRIAVNQELLALEELIPAAISKMASGGRLAIISFHSLEDRIVKRSFQRESGRCQCQAETARGKKRSDRSRWRAPVGGLQQNRQTAQGTDSAGGVICNRCGARKRVEVLTRKPVRPTPQEVERNPRSRSALLRVCEKL